MADKDNPNYQLLLDEINNLKEENATLKEENVSLNKKVDEVIEFNRQLLNKPAAKVKVESVDDSKFRAYMEGE